MLRTIAITERIRQALEKPRLLRLPPSKAQTMHKTNPTMGMANKIKIPSQPSVPTTE